MPGKTRNQGSCSTSSMAASCCTVESVVSVDERGQMVLPKEIRDKAGIHRGDKLALVGWEKDGRICCISLIKADNFAGMVRGLLGPMMEDIMSAKSETKEDRS